MNSNSPKVLHHVGNIPMIYYSINLAIKAKAKNMGIVISKDATEIKNFIKSLSINIKLFVQSNQLGTGHAILSAKEFETKSEDLIILYGDCPLITVDTIKKPINTKKKEQIFQFWDSYQIIKKNMDEWLLIKIIIYQK